MICLTYLFFLSVVCKTVSKVMGHVFHKSALRRMWLIKQGGSLRRATPLPRWPHLSTGALSPIKNYCPLRVSGKTWSGNRLFFPLDLKLCLRRLHSCLPLIGTQVLNAIRIRIKSSSDENNSNKAGSLSENVFSRLSKHRTSWCAFDFLQNGVVHRDLKLENILLDQDLNVKVRLMSLHTTPPMLIFC